jgi:uncharacterized protein (TIGR02246 family)
MKKLVTLFAIIFALGALLWSSNARATSSDEAQIRAVLDRWAKAFKARDLNGIMEMYAPDVVAYDLVPPLQYAGKEAYKRDYQEFLSQYTGPIDVEFRGVRIIAGNDVAFVFCLERIAGTLKGGQKSDVWVRYTGGFRKIKGKWLDVHDHVSAPIDLETGKAALELKP